MRNHTIIIGGGIVGLLSGRELLARGHRVTVVDAGTLTESASAGNAGVISPGHPPVATPEVARRGLRLMLDRRGPLYLSPRPRRGLMTWLRDFRHACRRDRFETVSDTLDRFSRLSRDRFAPLVEEFPEALRPAGFTEVARTPEGQRHLEHDALRLQRAGFAAELVSGDELRREDPAWGDRIRVGIRQPEGIVSRPAEFLQHLAGALEREGGILRTRTRVRRIVRDGRDFSRIELDSGEQLAGSSLLIASGIWSRDLVAQLGLRIPMEPAKGYHLMVTMETPPRGAGVLSEACVVVNPMGAAVRLAGTLEFSGLNHRLVRSRIDQLERATHAYLPGLARATRTSVWCGLRPCTGDGLPAIGPVPGTPNAFLATGHAMMGVTLGPGTAQLIADAIERRPWPTWARPLSTDRFRDPSASETRSTPAVPGR